MSETKLWEHLRTSMHGLWEAQRHEDRLQGGIPDVSYSTNHHGWIELKYLDGFPKEGAKVQIPHFTVQQRNWLTVHGKRGGHCFMLLQAGHTYQLFDWRAAWLIGTLTRQQMSQEGIGEWVGSINPARLLYLLEFGR